VPVSRLLAAAVRAGLDAAEATEGLVVPTLGDPLAAAGYDRTFSLVQLRAPVVLPVTSRHTAWRGVELDEQRGLLTVPKGIALDLGATAKSLAADRAASLIARTTGTGTLVSLGGDIAVAGEPPVGGWSVLIAERHDAPLTGSGPTVSIESGGVATSSTRVRRWRTRQGEMHHLLDPRTGRPAETPWRTVSVAARTCLEANVAATFAVVAGRSATAWLVERDLPARLVGVDGSVTALGGWPAHLGAAA
jgi:thiamine biosynthesis lipoprotein